MTHSNVRLCPMPHCDSLAERWDGHTVLLRQEDESALAPALVWGWSCLKHTKRERTERHPDPGTALLYCKTIVTTRKPPAEEAPKK
jgi:hypothetical protein